MRISSKFQALSAAAAIGLLVACSGNTSSSLEPALPQRGAGSAIDPAFFLGLATIKTSGLDFAHRATNFYGCPAKGAIEYVSDENNNNIDIFAGPFAGQGPCGQIGNGDLRGPAGLYVDPATHDLYVADIFYSRIDVFHRGQTSEYNNYRDPTGNEVPVAVAVARDGTVIASNSSNVQGTQPGSLSTWIGGPNGGTFVGNFPMMNSKYGQGLTILRRKSTIYYVNFEGHRRCGLWFVSCPAGACGVQTQYGHLQDDQDASVTTDNTGDLVVHQELLYGPPGDVVYLFELPNPKPSQLRIHGFGVGIAINDSARDLFMALGGDAAEFTYPVGQLVGTVPMPQGGYAYGIAVDR